MDLRLAKAWYFFYFGGMVCVWPYLNLLYRANGLDDSQIGILAAIKPWVSAPASFLWSGLADRYSCHRVMLLATFIISTLMRTSTVAAHSFAVFMLLAAAGEFVAAPVGVMADAAVVAASKKDTDYGKSRLWGAVAWGGLSTFSGWLVSTYGMPSGFAAYLLLSVPCVLCAWKLEFKLGSSQQQQTQQPGQQVQQSQQQAGQQPQSGLAAAACGAIEPGDVEQQPLMQQQQSDQYWSRLPAQPGRAADKLQGHKLGLQQQSAQQQQQSDLQESSMVLTDTSLVEEPLQLLTSGVDALVYPHAAVSQPGDNSSSKQHEAACQPDAQQQQQQHRALPLSTAPAGLPQDSAAAPAPAAAPTAAAPPPAFWRSLRQLLRRPDVLIFMFQACTMGFGIGVIGEFLFLYLQELGGSETLMGMTLTATCVAEVPVFHYQGTVLSYISVHTMLHIVMWTYAIRLGLYALLPVTCTPWAVLPIELLHGITFACGWGAGTINCKRVAPPELAATMQGIFQGLYFGVGQGLGALVGGVLKQRFGGQAMFAMCAAVTMAAWLLVVAAECATAATGRTGSSRSQADLQAAAGPGTVLQHQQQVPEQPPLPPQLLQQWWQRARHRLLGMPGGRSGAGSAGGSSSSSRRWKYIELGSKDSGPDLSALQ